MKSAHCPAVSFTISIALLLPPQDARSEQTSCSPNQAVYARSDGSEFIVRHVGVVRSAPSGARYYDPPGTRYLEGELTGPNSGDGTLWITEKVVFTTIEKPSPSGAEGRFHALGIHYSTYQSRYEIEWIEKPTDEPDQALISKQGPAWAGTWTLVQCNGKSARAAAAIRAAKPMNCPISRVIFVDENTGRRFRAGNYAEDFVYIHEGGKSKTEPKDKNGNPVWSRKVGYSLLKGTIEGSEAYLKVEQIWGTPSEILYSYHPGDRDLRNHNIRWLKDSQAPVVRDENKDEFTFGEIDIMNDFVVGNGPLLGMTLVPVGCNRSAR